MQQPTVSLLAATLVAAAIVGVAASASAAPNFPPEVETHLMLTYTPPCTICHAGAPGLTTATTPFALSLRAAGVMPNDTASLDKALDALEANMTDSNKDGTPDIAELKAGRDPNTGASISGGETIAYGCFAEIAGQSGAPLAGAAFTVVGLALAMRRRRR